jgi:hypothetical protein
MLILGGFVCPISCVTFFAVEEREDPEVTLLVVVVVLVIVLVVVLLPIVSCTENCCPLRSTLE